LKKISIGIIGLGNVYEFQKQALRNMGSIDIVALCDIDDQKAKNEASNIGTLCYSEYEELLSNAAIEAVLVSTPVLTHYEIGMSVLRAKKHLLIEKPAVLDIQELKDLYSTAAKNGVNLVVAFHAAFAKDLLWFKDKYQSELYAVLGPITAIDCSFFDPYVSNGVLDKRALALVGSWVDSGVNALSVAARLFDLNSLKLKEKLFLERKAYAAPNISASVVYENISSSAEEKVITIKTDWTLNINRKQCILYFDHTKNKVILDHSRQKVILINDLDEAITLADFSSEDERLTAHYKGVFMDFSEQVENNEDNFDFAMSVHRLLIEGIL